MRKSFSILLVLAMVCALMFSMSISAFAAQGNTSYTIGSGGQTYAGSGWKGSTPVSSVTIDGAEVAFTASGTSATVSGSVLDSLSVGAHTVNLHQDHYTDGEIDATKDTTFTLTVIAGAAATDPEPAEEDPPAPPEGEDPPAKPEGEDVAPPEGEDPPAKPEGEDVAPPEGEDPGAPGGENPPPDKPEGEDPGASEGENPPPDKPEGEDPGAPGGDTPAPGGDVPSGGGNTPSGGGSAPSGGSSKPSGSASGGASGEPKTGDSSNIGLWAAVIVLSGAAMAVVLPAMKRSK